MNCIICNNDSIKEVIMDSRDGDQLSLLKCTQCHHLYQNIDNYSDIYSTGEFTKIARGSSTIPSQEKIKQLDNTALKRFLFYKKYFNTMDNILEVGSSIGSFVQVMKLAGKKIDGLEPDEKYCQFSKKQYGFSQTPTFFENFRSDKKFDAIVSFQVIEHIKDPNIFVDKIYDILNEEGKILIECPSLEIHSFGKINQFIWKPHIHYFSFPSIYRLFSEKFDCIEIGVYDASLYIYAQKAKKVSINSKILIHYKKYSKKIYSLIHFLNSIHRRLPKVFSRFYLNEKKLMVGMFLHKVIKKIRIKKFIYSEKKNHGSRTLFHISYFFTHNAGDTVLSKCVRDVFNNQNKSITWKLQQVNDPVNDDLVNSINVSKGVIIGGGGLFLPDTNKNNISGWQWACSKEQLKKIQVPLIIFAVGFNYFKGHNIDDLFIENLQLIVDKADFIGLRNYGSINAIKELIGEEHTKKLVFQPCPTTLIRKLYTLPDKKRTKKVAFNLAFDRYKNRYGNKMNAILDRIALSAKVLVQKGYTIYNVCHCFEDLLFGIVLNKHGVIHKTKLLYFCLPQDIYTFYNNMDVVIGMRGHSQMIPFGLNCHIITLGTHNKMKWFMQDIDYLEAYVDITKDIENLDKKIIDIFESEYEMNYERTKFKLLQKQDMLFEITMKNITDINTLIK